MKQQSIIQKTVIRQNRRSIRYALASSFSTLIRIQRENGTPDIFLIRNEGKGPPGQSRSPDKGSFTIPDHKPIAGKSSKKYYQVTYYQCFNEYYI